MSHNVSLRDFGEANVRFWSKADMELAPVDVRFTPKSGHRLSIRWADKTPISLIAAPLMTYRRSLVRFGA